MLIRRQNRNAKYLFIPIGLAVLLIVLLALKTGYFDVNEVEINGQNRRINGLEIFSRQNILFLNTDQIERDLKQKNFRIESVSIKRVFPRKVILYLQERKPLIQILSEQNYYSLAGDGVVLTKNDIKSDLPMINISSVKLRIGEKLSHPLIIPILPIVDSLTRASFSVDKVDIDENSQTVRIELRDGTILLIDPNKDNRTLVSSLQIITSRFRIEGKTVDTLDLRFDKPIATFIP